MTTNLVALLCVFRFFVGSSANNITNARHVVLESERGTAIILDLRVFIEAVKARILKGAKIISVLSPMGGAGSFSELEQIVRRGKIFSMAPTFAPGGLSQHVFLSLLVAVFNTLRKPSEGWRSRAGARQGGIERGPPHYSVFSWLR